MESATIRIDGLPVFARGADSGPAGEEPAAVGSPLTPLVLALPQAESASTEATSTAAAVLADARVITAFRA